MCRHQLASRPGRPCAVAARPLILGALVPPFAVNPLQRRSGTTLGATRERPALHRRHTQQECWQHRPRPSWVACCRCGRISAALHPAAVTRQRCGSCSGWACFQWDAHRGAAITRRLVCFPRGRRRVQAANSRRAARQLASPQRTQGVGAVRRACGEEWPRFHDQWHDFAEFATSQLVWRPSVVREHVKCNSTATRQGMGER